MRYLICMKKNTKSMNKPWELPETPWKTEAAFWGWVRGQLRKGWSRHPVKHLYIKQRRYKSMGKRGKMVWHLDCEQCECPTPQSNIEIDHKIPAGSFTCKNDIADFVERLYFVTFDTIRAVCKDCHSVLTHQERHKIATFFEAAVDKETIKVMKRPAEEIRKLVEAHGYKYKTPKAANKDTVRVIVERGEAGVYL